MDKDQVLARLCALLTKVALEKFDSGVGVAHDCFCGENQMSSHPLWNFSMDPRVVEFVEEAVLEALTKPAEKIYPEHSSDDCCPNCCSSRGCSCAFNGLAPRR